MKKKEESLIFECLSVLLKQVSITINPEYQEKLAKKCEKFASQGDKE